ncbi:hypothetical protein GGI07_005456 [Coemansia sp. Benny D115]|nr:hypothetical protein GGI07_005456 [Coemansia sp. Benny D115]
MVAIFEDRGARNRIVWGTLGLAAAGSVVGLNVAILRNLQPIRRHTLTMSANWALCGFFFLTTREALLVEQRQKNDTLNLRISQTRDSDEMFSSAIAGGLTGGILAFISRGKKSSAITGAMFFGALGALGQFIYTKANHRRQQIIIEKMLLAEHPKTRSSLSAGPLSVKEEASGDGASESNADSESGSIVARMRRALSVDPITLLPDWFPVRRIPSDEYRDILVLRQEEIQYELKRLRQAIDDMDRREQVLLQRLKEHRQAK